MKEELIELVKSHYPDHKVDIIDAHIISNNMIMLVGIKDNKPRKVIYELLTCWDGAPDKLIMYSPSELNSSDLTKWKSIMRGAKILQLEEK
jgi:hypothetical protein